MKRIRPMILVLTAALAAIAWVFGTNEIGMRNFPFSVTVTSDGMSEEIRCIKLEGKYYVFLPSYAGSETRICTNRVYDVSIAGEPLQDGQSCEEFPVNTELELFFHSGRTSGYETVTFIRSGNVATMYLDVPSGDMTYIHEKKGNAEAASVRLYTQNGQLDYSGTAESFKGRGNATWEETEKKPYSLQLLQEADLLGMGKACNWVLLSNAWDSSNIRNKVAYDTAAAAGMTFSPESDWVDLYLNGEYAGLYLLSERNEVHSQRVDIPEETGFLVSLEFPYRLVEQNYPFISTEKGLALRIHHFLGRQQELESLWQSAENAILAENGIDPVTGRHWEQLIDLDSWAHRYLQEELFANFDAGSISQYFYSDLSKPEAKIMAGPIWDFDNSMGRGGWVTSYPQSFLANRTHFFSADDAPLFHGLYQKEVFRNRVVELFSAVYEPLLKELTNGGLQAYADCVSAAGSANRQRWSMGDPQEEVEAMEAFLTHRLEFYHDLWIDGTEYCTVEITSDSMVAACWLVRRGSTLPEVPCKEGYQWCNVTTGEPIDLKLPILENVHIQEMIK